MTTRGLQTAQGFPRQQDRVGGNGVTQFSRPIVGGTLGWEVLFYPTRNLEYKQAIHRIQMNGQVLIVN